MQIYALLHIRPCCIFEFTEIASGHKIASTVSFNNEMLPNISATASKHMYFVSLTLTALNPLISSFQMEGFRRIEVTRDMKWQRI